MKQSIHDYLASFDDIPGTRVFTARRARQGYHLNQFAMSLMKPENRERWKADERAYLAEWPMTDEQRAAAGSRPAAERRRVLARARPGVGTRVPAASAEASECLAAQRR